jgi:hypothetical protein
VETTNQKRINPKPKLSKELVSQEDALLDKLVAAREKVLNEVRKVIVGQDEVIDQTLISLFVGGHSLVTGAPGLAKTLLIRTLANVLDLSFKRIQFTPDLMPSDITGTDIIEEDRSTGHRKLEFIHGHSAQDSGGPARGDAGRIGHRSGNHLQAPQTVLCAGHSEPHRNGGHLSTP